MSPDGLHEAVALEAVEHGVQHAVRPLELAARQLGHALDDRVAVALTLAEDAQDQRGGRRGDEILANVHRPVRRAIGDRRALYIEALYIVPLCMSNLGC